MLDQHVSRGLRSKLRRLRGRWTRAGSRPSAFTATLRAGTRGDRLAGGGFGEPGAGERKTRRELLTSIHVVIEAGGIEAREMDCLQGPALRPKRPDDAQERAREAQHSGESRIASASGHQWCHHDWRPSVWTHGISSPVARTVMEVVRRSQTNYTSYSISFSPKASAPPAQGRDLVGEAVRCGPAPTRASSACGRHESRPRWDSSVLLCRPGAAPPAASPHSRANSWARYLK